LGDTSALDTVTVVPPVAEYSISVLSVKANMSPPASTATPVELPLAIVLCTPAGVSFTTWVLSAA
jgi:hypothetical protein